MDMKKLPVPVVMVVAMSKQNRVIGKNNQLLWHVPEDLKRFKKLTLGHPVIMGRKTFESIFKILGKPLPGRTNIVVTRNSNFKCAGVVVASSVEQALVKALSEHPTQIHIGGGGDIYRQVLPYTSKLYVTYFSEEPDGDTFFPEFTNEFVVEKEHPPQKHEGVSFQWVDYKRAK